MGKGVREDGGEGQRGERGRERAERERTGGYCRLGLGENVRLVARTKEAGLGYGESGVNGWGGLVTLPRG